MRSKNPLVLAYPAEHRSWKAMRARCSQTAPSINLNYAALGTTVCERWRHFENFLNDIGPKPGPGHSIDRFPDPAGNYEPGNARWATRQEQSENYRHTVRLTFQGETLVLREWSDRTGLHHSVIRSRINRGWSAERVLLTPLRVNGKTKPATAAIDRSFERLTIEQAAAELGLSVNSIQKYLKSGKLPGEKFGDVWVVYSRDLDLLRNRKTKPGPVKKAIKI